MIMGDEPIFSVSGLRGIVNDTLTIPVVVSYTEAFSRYMGGSLYLVGQDTRPHSLAIKMAVTSTLLSTGKEVIDLGIVPTPTLLLAVREKRSNGGIMITASHNPMEWNALKFVNGEGLFIESQDVENISNILKEGAQKWCSFSDFQPLRVNNNAIRDHILKIAESPFVELEAIRKKRFTVACDCINGAAFDALPRLLEFLGCDVIRLNCDNSGSFVRNPEPRVEYLQDLQTLMYKHDIDVAFGTDPDGDRLIVGFKGVGIISEEYSVPLSVYHVLRKQRGDVVVNLSTSMMVEDIARWFNASVYRAPVGEANVVKLMREKKAIIGGEGNGGVIFPLINPCRDALTGVALILSLMVEQNPVEIIWKIPRYYMDKRKIEWSQDLPSDKLIKEFRDFERDSSDGLYFRRRKEWVHIRKSNTEPIVRIYAESGSEEETKRLIERAVKCF